MKSPVTEVTLGRMRLKVPVIVDEPTTARIAERVNARLAEMEKQCDRIDSLIFALLAAMSFAAEVEQAHHALAEERSRLDEERAADAKEFFAELDTLSDALKTRPAKKLKLFPPKR